MKLINHFIKRNDFLGPKIRFTISKEENFKTIVGGLFSLIAYSLYLFFFIMFGLDMFFRRKPLIQMETLTDETQSYTIDSDTFLAFRIEDIKGNFINMSGIFSVYISYQNYDNIKQNFTEKQYFNFETCDDPKYSDYFTDFEMKIFPPQEWLCLNTSQIIGKNLSGTVDTDTYSYLSLQLDVCRFDSNFTNKGNCSDPNNVKQLFFLNDLNLAIIYPQINFFPKNFTFPLQSSLKKYTNPINRNVFQNDHLPFMKHLVKQDDSLLFVQEYELPEFYGIDQTKIEKYFSIKNEEELKYIYSTRGDPEINNIYNLIFTFDMDYNVYLRTYLKIQDVLANVNGIMDFLVFLFGITSFYARPKLDLHLFNKCVNVKFEESGNKIDKFEYLKKISFELHKRKDSFYGNENKTNIIYDQNSNKSKLINNQIYELQEDIKLENNNSVLKNLENIAVLSVGNHANNQINNKIVQELDNPKRLGEYSILNINYNNNMPNAENNSINEIYKESSIPSSKMINVNNFIQNENNIDNTQIKEIEREIMDKKIYNLVGKKVDYLSPNIFQYYYGLFCSNRKNNNSNSKKNDKKTYEFLILQTYAEKIKKKVDIFHYLKALAEMKSMKEHMLGNKDELILFNFLSKNVYNVKVDENYDCIPIAKKNKNLKIQRMIAYLNDPQTKLNEFIVDKFNEII